MTTSPLLRMTKTTPTVLWNDSADPRELSEAISWGAVGATCNPVIALAALKADRPTWSQRITEYAAANPTATEDEIGWAMVKDLSVEAARLLVPAFERYEGRNGRLSIQTDPRYYRDTDALVEQAVEFSTLAPNMIVKIPVTAAGAAAFEEATYRGVSINATVSFTVPQALAVAEAVERGLRRREAEGLDVSHMGPVCTIMVGRTDDWMRVSAEKEQITVDPGIMEWAGVAVFKRAYQIYQERGYRTRLLSAAFRNHMHWSQFIGGDVVISPPFGWQKRLNASGIEPTHRLEDPVDPRIVEDLYDNFAEFRKAYDVDGMTVEQFTDYGATRRTLRQFLDANNQLESFVRDITLPNPD
ncbi:MAG: transaldolase family protein [Candidatus Nanopelagicales bacterium]